MKSKNIKIFYGKFAEEYDEMIDFDNRIIIQQPVITKIVKDYQIKSAVDAGCGTGFYSILLAKSGVDVLSVDISKEMLEKLKQNSMRYKLKITPLNSEFADLHYKVKKKYDAIFCMGNTLPHIGNKNILYKVLKTFFNLINDDGVLIIQQLNYDRILRIKPRLQSVKQSRDRLFIRYYDYLKKEILFNVLIINQKINDYKITSVKIKPWKVDDYKNILREIGFKEVKVYEDIALNKKYSKYKSKDLVIFCRKTGST